MNEHVNDNPKVGDMLTCAETGKAFTVESDGFTFNYARNSRGEFFSDEGVHTGEVREMLDRSRPMSGYLSGDGKTFTGWKGNKLGTVTQEGCSRSGWHGSSITYVRVTDVHGGLWYGKGAGRSMYITLRACKQK
jgi:hypothetical protein